MEVLDTILQTPDDDVISDVAGVTDHKRSPKP
jgi:hypothetical protein